MKSTHNLKLAALCSAIIAAAFLMQGCTTPLEPNPDPKARAMFSKGVILVPEQPDNPDLPAQERIDQDWDKTVTKVRPYSIKTVYPEQDSYSTTASPVDSSSDNYAPADFSDDYSSSDLLPPEATSTANVAPIAEPPAPVVSSVPIASTVPVAPPAPVTPDMSSKYVVRKGDTLSKIASSHGTNWKAIAEYNGLSDPNKIFVGQELYVPSGYSSAPQSAPPPAPPTTSAVSPTPVSSGASYSTTPAAPIEGTNYVIQRGDTLSKIAERSGVTVAEIKAANGMTSDVIIAGKSLKIPGGATVEAPAPAAAPATVSTSAPAPAPIATAGTANAVSTPAPAPAPIAEVAPVAAVSTPATPTVSEPAATTPNSSSLVYEHVLYEGETVEDVARQYGSSKDEIMLLNGITDESSVKPGKKLLVPIPE